MNARDSKQEPGLSQALNEKVPALAIIGASVFIVAFLAIVIAKQQAPESEFVQTFLRGYRGWLAIVLAWGVVMASMHFVETRLLTRRDKRDEPDSRGE